MKTQKKVTLDDIRKLGPCYDPAQYAPEGWEGTPIDILKAEAVPPEDRIWVVAKLPCVPDHLKRLFATWCAREDLALLVKDPDPRSVAACDVAEKYAVGKATAEELDAAWAAAMDAAGDAARAAARDAEEDAVWAAARDAEEDAARAAAWTAAWAAAAAATRDDARAAAWAVARATVRDGTGDDAKDAFLGKAIQKFIELLKEEEGSQLV